MQPQGLETLAIDGSGRKHCVPTTPYSLIPRDFIRDLSRIAIFPYKMLRPVSNCRTSNIAE